VLQVAVREQVPEEIDHRGKAFGGNRMTDISDMEAPGLLLLVESFSRYSQLLTYCMFGRNLPQNPDRWWIDYSPEGLGH